MKQLSILKKISYIAIALIIIAGILVVALKGFNVELKYQSNQKVELDLKQKVDIAKIQQIADEVLGKGKSQTQIIEIYKESVQITAKEISEDQKNSLVEKVNELYPQEKEDEKLLDASKISVLYSPNVRLRDMFRPYIVPLAVSTVLVLVYFAVRYCKLGLVKIILKSGLTLVLAEATLISVMAIARIPMGRLTIPLMLLVYVSALIYISLDISKKQKVAK